MSLALVDSRSIGVGQVDDPSSDIRLGSAIAILFFVVLMGWAALAPLDAGVYAQGAVAVSGNRQSVQHREGGVVTAIHVREGQHVQAGEVLVEMSAPDLVATERALTSDYLNLLAQRARLLAERSGAANFSAPPEFRGLSPEDQVLARQALDLQRAQYHARLGSLSAQESVLGQRTRQIDEQRIGYVRQGSSLREQQKILDDEIAGLKVLERKGFASLNRIRALEQARAELDGREAAMTAEMARAGEEIGETSMQSLSLRRANIAEIATDLRDTQAKLSDVLPKLVSTREILQRSKVRSPVTGQVVGLTVFTIGGVVAPGQTLMEVVPDNRRLVIQAQIAPADADDLYQGQKAQVRFVSVHNRTLPLLYAQLSTISADSFTDEKSGRSFFRAELEVDPRELSKVQAVLGEGQIRPGLPVEVILAVRKRTALQYLLEPFIDPLWRSLREQ